MKNGPQKSGNEKIIFIYIDIRIKHIFFTKPKINDSCYDLKTHMKIFNKNIPSSIMNKFSFMFENFFLLFPANVKQKKQLKNTKKRCTINFNSKKGLKISFYLFT